MRLNRKWCKGNDISAYRIQCYPFFLPKVEPYNDVFIPKYKPCNNVFVPCNSLSNLYEFNDFEKVCIILIHYMLHVNIRKH